LSLQLYYFPGNASLAPHILLEELGVPFELTLVDRNANAHKSAAYLKLNPNGLIPTLIDGEQVITETAAIMLHLADKFIDKAMMPAFQSAERAQCYRWLIYLTNTVQAELVNYFYPDRLGGGEAQALQARTEVRLGEMLAILDAQIAKSTGPFFLGAQYTIVDVFLFMMCRWTRFLHRPASTYPQLAKFLAMMVERPAVIRVVEREQLAKPWY
jgi:glutathione S-transferase